MMSTSLLLLSSIFISLLIGGSASSEIISDLGGSTDLGGSPVDESRALEIKAEQFWQSILSAAEDLRLDAHLKLYADATAALDALPAENSYARDALSESLRRLRRADDLVLSQASSSRGTASAQLAAPAGSSSWDAGFSFFTGGQNFLSQALKRFTEGGRYSERVVEHVGQRQADVLPLLRGAAAASGDVLGDCRIASKRAFDLLKYDIYNKGVPKTPEAAKAVAHRLADAAGETRHLFMRLITETVQGITRDVEGRGESAASTVVKASLRASGTDLASAEQPGSGVPGREASEQLINL